MSRVDVDYQYYADVFKGDALTESDFKKHGMRAEAIVNRMTYGRIHEFELRPDDLEAVKAAICAVSEILAEDHRQKIGKECQYRRRIRDICGHCR